MGLLDWVASRAEAAGGPPEPRSTLLAADLVLMALVGPPGCAVEEFIDRAEAGAFVPSILDASLFWAMGAVRPSDTIRADRLARLLRYARIVPMDREPGQHGFTPASPEVAARWREVALDGGPLFELGPAQAAGARRSGGPPPEPHMLVCSRCSSLCGGDDAHVIPWWNEEALDFFTTFRCEACWLPALDELQQQLSQLDEDMQWKLCDFLRRHRLGELAQELESRPLPEAAARAVQLTEALRSRAIVLWL